MREGKAREATSEEGTIREGMAAGGKEERKEERAEEGTTEGRGAQEAPPVGQILGSSRVHQR